MNSGAELLMTHFPEFETTRKVLSQTTPSDWAPTHPDGPYQSDGWRVIKIVQNCAPTKFATEHPEILQVLNFFKCPIMMAVFYSMLPGAEIHPHRDLSGTLEFGRLRFHVPIETNPNVEFMVSKKRVPMNTGELWALNTSYLHAVANRSNADRIHLVLEVEANDWCWTLLPPKTMRFHLHKAGFLALVLWRGITVAITKPQKLKYYTEMAKFFVLRLLGRDTGKMMTRG